MKLYKCNPALWKPNLSRKPLHLSLNAKAVITSLLLFVAECRPLFAAGSRSGSEHGPSEREDELEVGRTGWELWKGKMARRWLTDAKEMMSPPALRMQPLVSVYYFGGCQAMVTKGWVTQTEGENIYRGWMMCRPVSELLMIIQVSADRGQQISVPSLQVFYSCWVCSALLTCTALMFLLRLLHF